MTCQYKITKFEKAKIGRTPLPKCKRDGKWTYTSRTNLEGAK